MNNKKSAVIFSIAVVVALIAGCNGGGAKKHGGGKLAVAVSIEPQAYIVEKIAGGLVDALVMVPPGASPHTYEMKAGQLKDVTRARVYFKAGTGIEFEIAGLEKLAGVNSDMKIVDMSSGIKLIKGKEHEREGGHHAEEKHHHEGMMDPHIWLSPRLLRVMAKNTLEGLIAADPGNAAAYRANAAKFDAGLVALDEELKEIFSETKTRKMIVYHPAWTYFCADYGIEQIPVEESGREALGARMSALVKMAKRDGIKVVFIEPQFNKKSAEVVAREIGGRVETIDPLARDVAANLRETARKMAGE